MPLAWPDDLFPSECEFFLQYSTTAFPPSEPASDDQVLPRDAIVWRCTLKFNPMTADEGRSMDALFAKLFGSRDTVALYDFARPDPAGDNRDRSTIPDSRFTDGSTFTDGSVFDGGAAGVTVWGGWDAGSETILTDGWWQSTSGFMLAGDYFGIDDFLYMLTDDPVSDSEGRAYFSFAPPLQTDVAHLAVVTRSKATSEFRMVDDDQANRSVAPGLIYSYALSLVQPR
jgi:hypothetical protein